jgi:uridine kinase
MLIVGIAGGSGSGKTTFTQKVLDLLDDKKIAKQVGVLHQDSYYLATPPKDLTINGEPNVDHPDAFDHGLLCEHLRKLQSGQSVEIPIYSHSQHIRLPETQLIGQHTIIVLEGILLFSDKELRELMNIRIFMSTPLDICLTRRLMRDVVERHRSFESVLHQYEITVRPMYLQFIEPSSRYADLIVPRGGENRIAIDMIKAKMRELLSEP